MALTHTHTHTRAILSLSVSYSTVSSLTSTAQCVRLIARGLCTSDIYIRSTSLFRVDPSSTFLKRLNVVKRVDGGEETISQNNTPHVEEIPAVLTEPVTNETFEMEKSTRARMLSVSSSRSIGSHRDSVSITMRSLSLSLFGHECRFLTAAASNQSEARSMSPESRPRNHVTIDISSRSPALAGHQNRKIGLYCTDRRNFPPRSE